MKLNFSALSVVRIDVDFFFSREQHIIFYYLTGKQMKHVNHFKIHMRSHRGINNCEIVSSSQLPSDSKRKYLCSTCGRACTSQSNLAVHTRRHTGTMTNFCNVCGKGYPRSTDLTIHMR